MNKFILGFDAGYDKDYAALTAMHITGDKCKILSSEVFDEKVPSAVDIAFDKVEERLLSVGIEMDTETIKKMTKDLNFFTVEVTKPVE